MEKIRLLTHFVINKARQSFKASTSNQILTARNRIAEVLAKNIANQDGIYSVTKTTLHDTYHGECFVLTRGEFEFLAAQIEENLRKGQSSILI